MRLAKQGRYRAANQAQQAISGRGRLLGTQSIREGRGEAMKEPGGKVSVVIPLYNHERYIEQSIGSVLGQTLAPFEIIVVDDGSTDGSADVVRRLCRDHPQIVFWSHPNQGAHHTLNAGIYRATGEFVAILNSDDVYLPNRLEACMDLMRGRPEASAVVTAVSFLDESGEEQESLWYHRARAYFQEVGDLSLALANANLIVSTSNLFLRRAVFSRVGHFTPLRYTHDLEFCLRLLASGEQIDYLEHPLLGYRLHPRNTISEDSHRVDAERAAVLAFFLYLTWRRGSAREGWRDYLDRFAGILEDQALTKLFDYFLSYVLPPPKDELARQLASLDGEFRHYLQDTGIDWRSAAPPQTLLSDLSSAIEGRRNAAKAVQQQHIDQLEEAREWLAGQNQRLEETIAQRDAVIDELKSWIASQGEAKDWLSEHAQRLEKAMADQEAAFAKQATESVLLRQRLEDVETIRRAQALWIRTLERSWPWRIAAALHLTPESAPTLKEPGTSD